MHMFLFWKSFQLLIESHLSMHFLGKGRKNCLLCRSVSIQRVWKGGKWQLEGGKKKKNKSVLPPFMIYSWDTWVLHLNVTFSWSQYCICKSKDFCISPHAQLKAQICSSVNVKAVRFAWLLVYPLFILWLKDCKQHWTVVNIRGII